MEILDFLGYFFVSFVLSVNGCVSADIYRGLKPMDPLIMFCLTSVTSMRIRLMVKEEEIGLLEGR